LKIQPENSTLGARIYDIDLRVLSSSAIRNIYEAWHEFAVLVFPKQHLDDKAHISFSSIFGGLERLLTASIADENPEICRVSNVRLDGRIDKLGDSYELHQRGNQYWHTDSSYKNVPSKASVLRAITVPESGGATEFADMRAAYDALDIEYRARLEKKVVVHDYISSQGLIGGLEQLTEQELLELPPVNHRLIQIHPGSGRKSLFVGRHASHIAGEDFEKSRAELVKITEDACQPPRVFSHEWREGDLVIWDNRCVLHRGRPWRQDQPRVMFRTTVAGDGNSNKWTMD
jgi:alpha-ketoglutarate-dependent taurine dioxygenase